MITKDEFLLLYEKNLSGQCTPDEKRLLDSYQDDILMPDDTWEPHLGDKKRLYHTVKNNLNQSLNQKTVKQPNYLWLKISASVLLVFAAGIFAWQYQHHQAVKPNDDIYAARKNIKPGGNKAYLTMANGEVVTLNDAKNGTLTTQKGVQVNKVKDGVLKYDNKNSAGKKATAGDLAFNTITIPRGGQYQVVLSDGTKVWLNSASSLKYPTVFAGKDRHVELTGEAYFEVAKDKHKPFKVKFNDQEVEVLGTHFDIMAYNDEAESKTTLLEGSVKISRDNMKQVLVPGQQAVSSANSKGFSVQQANIQEVMAWKNGFFMFRNVNIVSIMHQAARWYDVDVVYQGDLIEKEYGGRVSKYKNISELLHNLELTGTIHFKVEGRRVTVMQ